MKESFDDKTSYCRSLGHSVPFHYCRLVNNDNPCRKIKDCWFEQFDIEAYINEQYSAEEQKMIFSPPPPKIATLVDLIRKAKERS